MLRISERVPFLLVLLLLLCVPLALVPGVSTQSPSIHGKELMIRVLLAVIGISVALSPQSWKGPRLDLPQVGLLAFAAVQLLSSLFSGRALYSISESWHLWGAVILGLLVYRWRPSGEDCAKLVGTIAVAGALCALYGLLTYANLNPLGWLYDFDFRREEGGRNFIHSFFGNPEYFGGYAAPVAVLCVSRALARRQSLMLRGGWMGLGSVVLLALLLSGSRGAFLGFIVACLVVLVRQVPVLPVQFRRFAVSMLLLGAVGFMAFVAIFSTSNPLNRRDTRLLQRFGDVTNLQSASVRERAFFNALSARAALENPVIGSGLGTFRTDYFRNFQRLEREDNTAAVLRMAAELRNRVAEHAHNDYAEFLVTTGLAGMACLLLLISLLLLAIFKTPLGSPNPHLPAYFAGFAAAALCIFINAAFSFPLQMPARASLAWILFGAALACSKEVSKISPLEQPEEMALAHNAHLPERH